MILVTEPTFVSAGSDLRIWTADPVPEGWAIWILGFALAVIAPETAPVGAHFQHRVFSQICNFNLSQLILKWVKGDLPWENLMTGFGIVIDCVRATVVNMLPRLAAVMVDAWPLLAWSLMALDTPSGLWIKLVGLRRPRGLGGTEAWAWELKRIISVVEVTSCQTLYILELSNKTRRKVKEFTFLLLRSL